jgi:hypothetical protein
MPFETDELNLRQINSYEVCSAPGANGETVRIYILMLHAFIRAYRAEWGFFTRLLVVALKYELCLWRRIINSRRRLIRGSQKCLSENGAFSLVHSGFILRLTWEMIISKFNQVWRMASSGMLRTALQSIQSQFERSLTWSLQKWHSCFS